MKSHEQSGHAGRRDGATAVLHVGGLHYASENAVVERVLAKRPGVTRVEANPVAQTATVEYDRGTTSVEALQQWVRGTRNRFLVAVNALALKRLGLPHRN